MRMQLTLAGVLLALLAAGAQGALADGKQDFTFQGDATFGDPHGGQAIEVVVIHGPTRKAVGRQSATVSPSGDPSFSITFPDLLPVGEIHEVRYWIDSNFGGGAKGRCDPKAIDHQWSTDATALKSEPVTIKVTHLPGATADVCQSFQR